MNLSGLIDAYGYLAVFAIVALECVGLPIPGETTLILAAAYAGSTHRLSPWLIFLAAAGAAVIGGMAGYFIGDKGGYPLLRRFGHRVWLNERRLKVVRYLFDVHGSKVVFAARFVSVLRTYAAFMAGASRMQRRRFVLVNAVSGVVWAAVITTVSYSVGHAVERTSGAIGWLLAAAVGVIIGIAMLVGQRATHGIAARAEAAYPGPLE